jgi:NADH dehydrogenase
MAITRVTIFGGTGLLGGRIVQAVLARGLAVRAAVRHPDRAQAPAGAEGRFEAVRADLAKPAGIAAALEGAQAAVNAVSLYHEHGGATFQAVHVDGARAVAEAAARAGLERLVHLSGIGADPDARDAYIRARGQGEGAVRAAFPETVILRPSAVFAEEAGLLTTLEMAVRNAPVVPLFGSGDVRLQPVHAGDVAEAAAAALLAPDAPGRVYELGGPEVLSYRQLLGRVMRATGRRRPMLPMPLGIWDAMARAAARLENPPITRGVVALMARDNTAAPGLPGLTDLGVTPTGVDAVLNRGAR